MRAFALLNCPYTGTLLYICIMWQSYLAVEICHPHPHNTNFQVKQADMQFHNIFNYIICIHLLLNEMCKCNLFSVIKSGAGHQPAGSPGNEETEPTCKYHPATWTDFVSTGVLPIVKLLYCLKLVSCHINLIWCFSDKETGTVSLICELMEMNIYEFIQRKSASMTIIRTTCNNNV